ncbi:MAG: ferritin-like domain-containing protein [Planctomycetaceae bacterium]
MASMQADSVTTELREIAQQIVRSTTLEAKLSPLPEAFADAAPGLPQRIDQPGRPENLQFAPRRGAPTMPPFGSWKSDSKRGLVHHLLANHELQALEVMAWVLLAFPNAPAEFRSGLLRIMADEQRHTRMHVERAARLGVTFGDFPVNSYIWTKAMEFTSLLDYLAGLPLVLEGANLDHSLEFAEAFAVAGDERSAAVMRTIHRDEITHVAFGIEWLRRLQPDGADDWTTFTSHLHWPLRAHKARGTVFQREARLQAGLSPEFVDRLEQAVDDQSASGDA